MDMNGIAKAGGLVMVCMTLIQIAPIKIDPWTWLARRIGRAINGEVLERMDRVEKTIADFKAERYEHDAKSARAQILRFGDEILHGVKHSKEHFDECLRDCDMYEAYCKDHPDFANGVAAQTIRLVRGTYQTCMEEKSFL